jgi:CarD family transcriptional regulator
MKTKKNAKKVIAKKASKPTPIKAKKLNKKPDAKKIVGGKTKKIVKTLKKPEKKIVKEKNILKTNKIIKKAPKKSKEKASKSKISAKKENVQKTIKKSEEKSKKPAIISKKKPLEAKQNNYSINSYVVYPSHGVGKIIDIETISVMQQQVSCYMIYFDREKLTIKIPTNKVEKFGIRPLVSKEKMNEVFSILRSGVKKMKGMWSRRAQEYETKINSGDIIMLAEVLRDLTRDIEDSERSYSERIIYETAIFRLACEYSAIYGVSFEVAKDKVTITAKDKLESESKSAPKDDDFDDFDKIKKSNDGEDDEEDEEEEDEEEEDDFNYEYNEDDDFDDDSEKPRKKKK